MPSLNHTAPSTGDFNINAWDVEIDLGILDNTQNNVVYIDHNTDGRCA